MEGYSICGLVLRNSNADDLFCSIHTGYQCVLKCAVQFCVLCGVYQKRELTLRSGHTDVPLHDVLAFMVGLQHFRLHKISDHA